MIIYFADLNPSRIIPIDINIPFPLATISFRKCNYGKVDIVFRAREFLSCRVIVLVRSDTWSVKPTVQTPVIVGRLMSNVEENPAGKDGMEHTFHSRIIVS